MPQTLALTWCTVPYILPGGNFHSYNAEQFAGLNKRKGKMVITVGYKAAQYD